MNRAPSPLTRLQAAENAYQLAQSRCHHLDHEHNGADHACCIELHEAARELANARKVRAKESA